MTHFDEIGKGVGMFILINSLLYAGWGMMRNLLSYTVSQSAFLGAISWISLICCYICVGVVYPVYAIIISSDPNKSTNFFCMAKGLAYWVMGTVACLLVFMIADNITSALTSTSFSIETLSGGTGTVDTTDTVTGTNLITTLLVIVIYVLMLIIAPLSNISKGFSGEKKVG